VVRIRAKQPIGTGVPPPPMQIATRMTLVESFVRPAGSLLYVIVWQTRPVICHDSTQGFQPARGSVLLRRLTNPRKWAEAIGCIYLCISHTICITHFQSQFTRALPCEQRRIYSEVLARRAKSERSGRLGQMLCEIWPCRPDLRASQIWPSRPDLTQDLAQPARS
jgi:hypothetical protein